MNSSTARSCRDPAFSLPEAIKPRNPRLTEVEIEILVRLLGYGCTAANAAIYLDREVYFGGAARVAQAALIPGAIWLTAATFLHTEGWLNLFGLLVVFVMHVPTGWIYAGVACRYLPRRADVLPANPFQPIDEETDPDPKNPFRGGGD